MSKRHPNLLSWQWRHYADQHRHPTNLLLHLIAAPLLLLSLLLLMIGLWHMGFIPLVLAAIGLYGALCLQAQVHRLEQNQPPPSVASEMPASICCWNRVSPFPASCSAAAGGVPGAIAGKQWRPT